MGLLYRLRADFPTRFSSFCLFSKGVTYLFKNIGLVEDRRRNWGIQSHYLTLWLYYLPITTLTMFNSNTQRLTKLLFMSLCVGWKSCASAGVGSMLLVWLMHSSSHSGARWTESSYLGHALLMAITGAQEGKPNILWSTTVGGFSMCVSPNRALSPIHHVRTQEVICNLEEGPQPTMQAP
uniref:Uncharacterized protein n=1 Tax=Molossus molossus TaxID=27622 RepID=A0A7J8I005_MOLMO|nr:hypothetical protein HJG59_010790 [Molossus molossus]